jgi:hypothetical protein
LVAVCGGDHELVALEQPDGGRFGTHETRSLRDDLAQDRIRIELARQQRAGSCELLCDRPRLPFRFVELGALERAASRTGEVVGELDLVVGEGLLLREEDEPETRLVASRRLDRDCKQ